MSTSSSIVIIGAGEIGRALGNVLCTTGNTVVYWDKTPVPNQRPLSEILPAAHVVFFCTPSWAVRPAAAACKKFLSKKAVVVCVSKGLEKKTGKSMDQVLSEVLPEVLPGQPFALLLGPMLAEELEQKQLGVTVIATKEKRTFTIISKLFSGSNVRCEWEKDVHTAAILSVLKNVYALSLGIADGLKWGLNAKGWLVAQALREMDALPARLRGKSGKAMHTAGAGDFLATAFSPYSKNRAFGERLVNTGVCDLTSEGCVSLPLVAKRIGTARKRFPLLVATHTILLKKGKAKQIFEGLLPKHSF